MHFCQGVEFLLLYKEPNADYRCREADSVTTKGKTRDDEKQTQSRRKAKPNMNILISNDDGINARGISVLARVLKEAGDVNIYACAPDGQRSGAGHGITMTEAIRVEEVIMENAEIAFQTSGLPADCVKVGAELMKRAGIEIDMVFSGINLGANLGTDTLYSGTVAAALEGSICGFPSVAVSVDSHEAEHFEMAGELAVKAMQALKKQIEKGTADHKTVLNINTPNLPADQIKGVKFTSLGLREYDDEFAPIDRILNVKVPGEFHYHGTPVVYNGLPNDIDVIANQEGYASITPIHADQTHHHMIEKIKTWGLV